jgi:GT2 family glycosyltransferase
MPEFNELVSFVILNWNRKQDLSELLDCIKKQTYKHYEIIVADNGSSDDSADMVRKDHPDVKLVVIQENIGIAGWNVGFKRAKGELICLLDNDVSLPKDWTDKLVKKFRQVNKTIGLIAPKVFDPWGLRWPSKQRADTPFYCGDFQGSGFMARKHALDQTNLYPSNYFLFENEHALAAQLLSKGFKILYSPEISHFHKGNLNVNSIRVYFTTRNGPLTIIRYYPMRLIAPHVCRYIICKFLDAVSNRQCKSFAFGLISFVRHIPACLSNRIPVSNRELLIRK